MRTPNASWHYIETVAALEQESRQKRRWPDRLAETIARFVGSLLFVALHLAGFAFWVYVNTGQASWIKPFDPFPFILLALFVSCEGVLLSTFVLIRQNRMSLESDYRAHLNLQIDLLAEREITKLLQLQRLMCDRLGIEEAKLDHELRDLSQITAVRALADRLAKQLEDQAG